MNEESLLLVGAGGHARACIDVIEQEGRFVIIGLIGQSHEVGSTVLGYSVLGTDADFSVLHKKSANALITVGQIKTPEVRQKLFEQLKIVGYVFPTIVSPHACVSKHARLGEGTIVMHGAIVNASAVVGRNGIVNSQALIEHDVVVADHCHIATAAAINSGVQIGVGTFIGSNSSVRQGVKIGANCVVGMGQRVLADCADGTCLPPRQELL